MSKRLTRIICLLMAMVMGVTFVSCGDKENNGNETSIETQAPVVENTILDVVASGKSDYKIIYPENAPETIMDAVKKLIDAIEESTGVKLKSEGDFLLSGTQPNTYEILIGKTNREETATATSGFYTGDYTISVQNSKLVICGATNSQTLSAVVYFINNFMDEATTGSLLFSSENNYKRNGTYFIKNASIAGTAIENTRFVVPAQDGAIESYIAGLIKMHLSTYAGIAPEIVTDATAAAGTEILIGKTNRSTVTAAEGKYSIQVTESAMEIVSSTLFGYIAAFERITKDVFTMSKGSISLLSGDKWNGEDAKADYVSKTGELRIMYHNVWGYLNADQKASPNPVANRADLALKVYQAYSPEVLCLQEAGTSYRESSKELFKWLNKNYIEICFKNDGGVGNPIFYDKDLFTAVEIGYNKSRSGDKGTTWVVLRRISDNTLFAVTNSHFAANTNASGDATLGDQYRLADANAAIEAINNIRSKHGDIVIVTGGDFNSTPTTAAYNLFKTGGFKDARDTATQKTDKSAHHGSYTYFADYGLYELQSKLTGTASTAIDHILTIGDKVTIHSFQIANDRISLTTSDHAPLFIDVTLAENAHPDPISTGENDPVNNWDGVTVIEPFGTGTQADPYKINNAANLLWMSQQIGFGSIPAEGVFTNPFAGQYFEQTADINLNGKTLKSIGYYYSGIACGSVFGGIYDGCGYLIKNGTIENPGAGDTISWGTGLFGAIYGATIKNVNVENVAVKGLTITGAIVGITGSDTTLAANAQFNTIQNCTTDSQCSISATVVTNTGTENKAAVRIGGIVGKAECITITNCINNATINLVQNQPYGGGIAASAGFGVLIDHCGNNGNIIIKPVGDITSTEEISLSGIVGMILPYGSGSSEGTATSYSGNVIISNTYNTGVCEIDCTNVAVTTARTFKWGGIIGSRNKLFAKADVGGVVTDNEYTIRNCYNTGNVTSYGGTINQMRVGGLIGSVWVANGENTTPIRVYDSYSTDVSDGTNTYKDYGIARMQNNRDKNGEWPMVVYFEGIEEKYAGDSAVAAEINEALGAQVAAKAIKDKAFIDSKILGLNIGN